MARTVARSTLNRADAAEPDDATSDEGTRHSSSTASSSPEPVQIKREPVALGMPLRGGGRSDRPVRSGVNDTAADKLAKRLKHREYVNKSYHKKLTTLETLKTEVDALELQYNALLVSQQLTTTASIDRPDRQRSVADGPANASSLLRQYKELAALKTQFQKENAELYELNGQFMLAESRVQQLVDAESQRSDRPSQHPSSLHSTRHRFRFKSLPDAAYAKIIATARDDILKFAYDTEKLSSGSRVFGWTDQRKIVGDELKFALEKEFTSVSAYELLARSWPIFSTPERFAKIYSPSLNLQFHALQHVNDDTHLFFRTVQVDGSDFTAKTVFLLARIRIEQGFMVMFRAIDADAVAFRESESNYVLEEMQALAAHGPLMAPRKEIWVDKYSWVIFQETGPESCLFHFGGSTLSNLWLKEVLFIALRWETLAVRPPIMLDL